MEFQRNVSLLPFNTFGIDRSAKFFTTVQSESDVVAALKKAQSEDVPVIVLGGGSNILLTRDLDALILKIEIEGIEKIKEDENHVWIEVGAGVNWHHFVIVCIEKNWAGVENLSLIPGTVGASPMQNIGAYGIEIKEVFDHLTAVNRDTLDIEKFNWTQCEFGYRESVFKNKLKDKYIITKVCFKLNKNPVYHTEYGAIKDTLQEMGIEELNIKAISDAVIQIRQSKLPDPKEIGNAGSFFKNPSISKSEFERLQKEFPNIPGYPLPEGVKVPAAWLIEQSGWKGKRLGQIGVHQKQPLVLVNYGGGDGAEIVDLSKQIQVSVLEKFGIHLSPEVNFL
ncbi:UDP-N-acetylmuramate dehydrogenase [Arthrospiribacter ruber]|uniref:UDP-N-acetylenolpyruvoylglucosamine reductase n=1 Tax=Arthrospiribacter ruber TaxID=2487934 RepID=A0A951MCS3_9BACT|nr:UDP-N-acetylmuramate dehydrogenase [Arthrospiribacter ruber]MBW3466671.1 UDP-N-acetylmuramate dehydrogenase [Arthrospiribacter ruber]